MLHQPVLQKFTQLPGTVDITFFRGAQDIPDAVFERMVARGMVGLFGKAVLGEHELFGLLCDPANSRSDPAALAAERGMMIVRDDAAVERWCEQAISENAKAAEDVRSGKLAAIGRLVGAVMKLSGGASDASRISQARAPSSPATAS
jgi:hypothetical protein